MTPEQIARARWVQNSPSTMILKCCVRDGSAVIAIVAERECGEYYRWQLGDNVEAAPVHVSLTRHAAMRRVRKALREANNG